MMQSMDPSASPIMTTEENVNLFENIQWPPENEEQRAFLEHRPRSVWVSHEVQEIKAFPCVKSADTQWFVAYDLQRKDVFLIEYLKFRGLIITALIAPSSSFSILVNSNPLSAYFLRQTPSRGTPTSVHRITNINTCLVF